jgi:hypothetical protein
LKENKFSKYLLYAIGEIVLVVIGILIALQINNWNESRKVNNTAKILAISLIEDLNKDVSFLTETIEFSKQKLEDCDELLSVLKTPKESWDESLIYEKINIIGQSNPFFPTDGTYEQIVTSGALQYFDQFIANQLNAYNMNIKQILYWADVEDKTLWLLAEILWKGVDVQALGELRFNLPLKTQKYIKIPEESIREFSNYVAAVKTYRSKTLTEYEEQLGLAENIISSLKKEYEIN